MIARSTTVDVEYYLNSKKYALTTNCISLQEPTINPCNAALISKESYPKFLLTCKIHLCGHIQPANPLVKLNCYGWHYPRFMKLCCWSNMLLFNFHVFFLLLIFIFYLFIKWGLKMIKPENN